MWGSATAMFSGFLGVSPDILFDVLNLFAKLIDDRLELQAKPRDVDGVRLRAQCVGLAVEFLGEKIELPSDGSAFDQNIASGRDVSRQALQFLFDVGAGRDQHGFLVKAVVVQRGRRIHETADRVFQAAHDCFRCARRGSSNARRKLVDLSNLFPDDVAEARTFCAAGLAKFFERGLEALRDRLFACRAGRRIFLRLIGRLEHALDHEELRRIGVGLAVDGFGTGQSSLSRLHSLPFTTVKVDKSLIDGVAGARGGDVIVHGVVGMAHGLGLVVVAEGVEQPEQLYRLRELGGDLIQGFLLHRPLPLDELVERLPDPAGV